jgi:NhaP-type Na+/H+ or K+/H+ antiporter
LVGLVMVLVKAWVPDFPVSEEQVVSLAYVLAAYIMGTALEDSGRMRSTGSSSHE